MKTKLLTYGGWMALMLCLLGICGCSAIKIETGPASNEEATRSSEVQAKGLRSDFSNRLEGASPQQKAWMVKGFIDSVTVRYYRVGFMIADHWDEGNDGRGQDIPAAEMQRVVENSFSKDFPLFESYDDIVDYGLNEIRETRFFDDGTDRLLAELGEDYYAAYNYVFYPKGNARDYRDGLYRNQTDTEELSRKVSEDLNRY